MMRVGVFTGPMSAMEGGGATLRSSILDVLRAGDHRHDFVVFQQKESAAAAPALGASAAAWARSRIRSAPVLLPVARALKRSVELLRDPGDEPSFAQKCLQDSEIDVAWFLLPYAKPVTAPYIATVWDLEHRKQPLFPEVSVTGWTWEPREQNFRALLPRAARILTGTQTGKKEIVTFYDVRPENVRVIPHPPAEQFRHADTVPRSDIRAKYGLRRPFIFYPAQFWPHKNHINLLLALRLVNQRAREPIDLVLGGSDKGNLSYVREKVREFGLAEQVHILGFIPAAEMTDFYREAIALVYATLFGPDNLPPLEAFATGCPVAASNIDGAADQLGDAAVLFDPVRPDSIADAIETIQRDDVRADLISRGRELVAQRTPRRYVESVCDILDELEPYRRCWGREYVHS